MQVVYIVDEMFTPRAGAWIGFGGVDIKRRAYDQLHYDLAKEYGVARLAAGIGVPDHADAVQRVQDFIVRGEIERLQKRVYTRDELSDELQAEPWLDAHMTQVLKQLRKEGEIEMDRRSRTISLTGCLRLPGMAGEPNLHYS